MANVIRNGDFERGLREWDVLAERPDPPIGVRESPVAPRGHSLHIEGMVRWARIGQSYPWVVYAAEGHLHLSFRGAAADFYVNLHHDDGTTTSAHFYGHWPHVWESEEVPVSTEKGIVRLEFLVVGALDFYLDDISLEGSTIPRPFSRARIREIPEQVFDYDMRFPLPPLMERLDGIERELKRIRTALSQQQDPDLVKDIEDALGKRPPKKTGRSGK